MSAVKIIFKRSSVLGKRPTSANLEAGEIGLNTNPVDPGLFFETNNGSIAKVGPTAYLPAEPTNQPAKGELWVNSVRKSLSIGDGNGDWQQVAAPYLGGTNGLTVFVAPEFPEASDALSNDGQAVPFITINRAILEVTKNIIQNTVTGLSTGNNRYLIILVPGTHCVVNNPGASLANFSVDFNNQNQEVTQGSLAQFNPEVGGLIIPRGVSIIGLDLKKCVVHPIYVPKYTHPLFPAPYQQVPDGPTYGNQPLSSIFRWSGNSYLSNFNNLDKIDSRLVTSTSIEEGTGFAIFSSAQPHGLGYNDFVQVDYSNIADQASATFRSGAYYVNPINTFEFYLSTGSWDGVTVAPILGASLPTSFFGVESVPSPKFLVRDIYPYYVPAVPVEEGGTYETHLYSHHRLSVLKNASEDQLNAFYTKVQRAFSNLFGGRVNTELATTPEYQIVATTDGIYPNNLPSNSVDNSSPYQNIVNHRSNYGMANGDYDGNLVTGFKSVIINSSTAVVLQRDPVAYQIYSTVNNQQQWVFLSQYVQTAEYSTLDITQIPTGPQLQVLNETAIPNIRYYYSTLLTPNGQNTGITDIENDFRHFGFRLRGPNSYIQAQSTYTIGAAIACWTMDGALMSLTNATSNFGSVAFQAEGFAGMGTLGGANDINKGFLQSGIVRPLSLLDSQVRSDQQKSILTLGSQVVQVALDPNDPETQLIFLRSSFDPASILPFSLRPGTAVFTTDTSCTYRAFFVTDGTPTVILSESNPTKNPYSPGGAILRVRASDSTIPVGPAADLEIPYIRRFLDPRTPSERSYGFYVQSTNPTSQAPQLGSVLRLNQTGQNLSKTLKRNYQFDPGQYGGIAQVFTVDYVQTEQFSASLNFNNKVSDSAQSSGYVIYTSLTDAGFPWIQSIWDTNTNELVPYNTPQGSYITYDNKNYFAAENNLWIDLYYETNFTPDNGPTKVNPASANSPFVPSSVTLDQQPVAGTWEGYVPTDFYGYYANLNDSVPEEYRIPDSVKETMTYMRGAVVPYTQFADQFTIDLDDSSSSLGIIYTRLPNPLSKTISVDDSVTIQTAQEGTTPYVASPQRSRPAVIQMDVLAVKGIANPKQKVSVLQLTYTDTVLHPELSGSVEFVRVISVTSNTIQVIRNYYPEYSVGTLPEVWPKGTTIVVCEDGIFPEPSLYDPSWSVTKATILRFYQLMGYSPAAVKPFLVPKYSGDRLLLNTGLQLTPSNGYATTTAAWPVEFNNPSSIIANTHTWQYVGYFDYSRGLPKNQTNEISRKLQYDFLSTTLWGGRLTVVGAQEAGNVVVLGPIREALTGNYYNNESPALAPNDRELYQSPTEVPFPTQVLVYSTDDISGLFDGTRNIFPLERGGYSIPTSQISTTGLFVFIGGVLQIPNTGSNSDIASYEVIRSGSGLIPEILFYEAPPADASCDIRVVTSDDESQTLEVVTFTLLPEFDDMTGTFSVSPALPEVTNLNSFVFLGGVEQNPFGENQESAAYTISLDQGEPKLTFIGGSPQAGTTFNMRGILSGSQYRDAAVQAVYVTSTDDISPLFDDVTKVFPLTVNDRQLDPTIVNSENMFVSLGGVMQIPFAQEGDPLAGLAYTVGVNPLSGLLSITFATAPLVGTTCNIRVVTSSEFITCPLPNSLLQGDVKVGPGVGVNFEGQLTNLDSGLVG